MLFDSVLFVDYLKHVLEDPEPRTLRNVCLNEYREENGVKRKFTDTSIESFEGMSKGSVNKTYRPKFEEMNRILREYIDGKRYWFIRILILHCSLKSLGLRKNTAGGTIIIQTIIRGGDSHG